MKVLGISSAQNGVYAKRNVMNRCSHFADYLGLNLGSTQVKPAFKGDTGAALGVFGGAALGALTAAIIVATGGLAAPVAAVGLGGVMATGAGAGTHIGGIIGHFIEEKLDK